MAEFVGCRHFGGGAVTALAVFGGGRFTASGCGGFSARGGWLLPRIAVSGGSGRIGLFLVAAACLA